jgi:hypothetical protein
MDPVVIVVMGILTLYFLPTLIGVSRGHGNPILLACANAATGWTVWGWIVCLGWSVVLPYKREVFMLEGEQLAEGPDDDGGEPLALPQRRIAERIRRMNSVDLVAIQGGKNSPNPRRVMGER